MELLKSRPETDEETLPALLVTFGATSNRRRPLAKSTTLLGKGAAADIVLDSPDVAAIHSIITRQDRLLFIRDCKSRTGTLVNDKPVREAELKNNDLVQIGPFSFRVFIPESLLDTLPKSAAASQEVTELVRSLEQQKREMEQRLAMLAERENEFVQAFAEINERQAEVEKARSEMEMARGQASQTALVAPLGTGFGSAAVDPEKQRQEILASEVGPLQELNDVLKRQVADAKKEVERLRQQMQSANAEIGKTVEFKQKNETLESQLKESKNLCSMFETQLRDAMGELDRMQKQFDAERKLYDERIQSLGTAAPKPSRESVALTLANSPHLQSAEPPANPAELDELRQKLEQITLERDESQKRLTNEREDAERRVNVLKEEVERGKNQIKQLAKDAASQYTKHRQELDELQRKLAERSGAIAAQLSANPAANDAQTKAQIDELTLQLETVQNYYQQLQQQNTDLQTELQTLQDKLATQPEVPSDLREYEAQLQQFRDQLEAAQADFAQKDNELQSKVKETELQLARERAELARERSVIERMKLEFKAELQNMERDATIRQKLAPINRLKDELRNNPTAQPADTGALTDKIRRFLKRMGD